jgi:hypothetical protein
MDDHPFQLHHKYVTQNSAGTPIKDTMVVLAVDMNLGTESREPALQFISDFWISKLCRFVY